MRFLGAVSAITLLALSCGSASAAIVQITYVGTVSSGTDGQGRFGLPGSSLAGDAYTMVFRFNTNIGRYDYPDGQGNQVEGGTNAAAQPLPTPSLGTTVTINGQSSTIDGTYVAYDQSVMDNQGYTTQQFTQDSSSGLIDTNNYAAGSIRTTSMLPTNIDTPFHYTYKEGDEVQAYFSFDSEFGFESASAFRSAIALPFGTTSASLNVATVDVASLGIGAVPEPSTWAMMLIGFGGLGFAAYRKTRDGRAMPMLAA